MVVADFVVVVADAAVVVDVVVVDVVAVDVAAVVVVVDVVDEQHFVGGVCAGELEHYSAVVDCSVAG